MGHQPERDAFLYGVCGVVEATEATITDLSSAFSPPKTDQQEQANDLCAAFHVRRTKRSGLSLIEEHVTVAHKGALVTFFEDFEDVRWHDIEPARQAGEATLGKPKQ